MLINKLLELNEVLIHLFVALTQRQQPISSTDERSIIVQIDKKAI